MSFLMGFIIIIAICALAVWFIPMPRYGTLRGCTGRALQAVMEREKEARDTKKECPSAAKDKPNRRGAP